MSRRGRGFALSALLVAAWLTVSLFGCPLSSDQAWGQDKPRYGGTFIVGSGGDPVTLNLSTDFSTIDTLAASPVKNEFRLSLMRVTTLARVTAKDDPDGTSLAQGGLGPHELAVLPEPLGGGVERILVGMVE